MVRCRARRIGLPRGVMNLGVRESLGVAIFGVTILGVFDGFISGVDRSGDLDRDGEWYWDGGVDTGGGVGASEVSVAVMEAGRGVTGLEFISSPILVSLFFCLRAGTCQKEDPRASLSLGALKVLALPLRSSVSTQEPPTPGFSLYKGLWDARTSASVGDFGPRFV